MDQQIEAHIDEKSCVCHSLQQRRVPRHEDAHGIFETMRPGQAQHRASGLHVDLQVKELSPAWELSFVPKPDEALRHRRSDAENSNLSHYWFLPCKSATGLSSIVVYIAMYIGIVNTYKNTFCGTTISDSHTNQEGDPQMRIQIPRWFDRHLHVRDGTKPGDMMHTVLPYTLQQRATGAVIMGNLAHPDETSTIAKARAYHARLTSLISPELYDFRPMMTCYLTDDIDPDQVVQGYRDGVWGAVKLYLADSKGEGGTTNASHGVRDLKGRYPVLAAMEREGIPFLTHCEAPEADVDEFDREIVGLERYLKPALEAHPKLRTVVEHVGDVRVADFVATAPYDIQATVTLQTLTKNRNALFRGGLNPGSWCKPVLKREEHRVGIRKYVTSGHRRFGAGTDSAPHPEGSKARYEGCNAGIFTAPIAVEGYTTVFAEDNALDHLGNFMSVNFLDIYGMYVSSEMMTIERTPLHVPEKIGNVRVFLGGQTLPYKLVA